VPSWKGGGNDKTELESESGQDIFYLCSKVDGEWYSTITAKLKAEGAEPVVAIAGPFADAEETKAYNDRRRELVDQRGKLYLTDMASVPAKIRQTLTDDVLRGWRQDDFKRRGTRRGLLAHQSRPKELTGK
jgi:hypothetical protein